MAVAPKVNRPLVARFKHMVGSRRRRSFLGIFLIPVLYVVFQGLREKIKGEKAPAPATAQPAAAATPGH